MRQKRILCVDGLVSMLPWLTALKQEDFVIVAASAEEGEVLEALGTQPVDLVVLTSAVNNVDALALRMKKAKPDIPIILYLPTHDNGTRGIDKVVRDSGELVAAVGELIQPVSSILRG